MIIKLSDTPKSSDYPDIQPGTTIWIVSPDRDLTNKYCNPPYYMKSDEFPYLVWETKFKEWNESYSEHECYYSSYEDEYNAVNCLGCKNPEFIDKSVITESGRYLDIYNVFLTKKEAIESAFNRNYLVATEISNVISKSQIKLHKYHQVLNELKEEKEKLL